MGFYGAALNRYFNLLGADLIIFEKWRTTPHLHRTVGASGEVHPLYLACIEWLAPSFMPEPFGVLKERALATGDCRVCGRSDEGREYASIAGRNLSVTTEYWNMGTSHGSTTATTIGDFVHFSIFICRHCRRRRYLLLIFLPLVINLLGAAYCWLLVHYHLDNPDSFLIGVLVLVLPVCATIFSGVLVLSSLWIEFVYPRRELMNQLASKVARSMVKTVFSREAGSDRGQVTVLTPHQYRKLKKVNGNG